MALSLESNDKVLVAKPGNGRAIVVLKDGTRVAVSSSTRIIPSTRRYRYVLARRAGSARLTAGIATRSAEVTFDVRFGDLPKATQNWYMERVNRTHKTLLKMTPKQEIIPSGGLIPTRMVNGRVTRVRVEPRYRDVPRPVKPAITENTVIRITQPESLKGNPALRVGKPLTIVYSHKNINIMTQGHEVGEIAGFIITNPATR